MTFEFRIILLIASALTFILILGRIRRSKARIDDAVFWIVLASVILLFALFPVIPNEIAQLLHVFSTENFLFALFIFLLLVKLFTLSMQVSQLQNKVERLTQEGALAAKAQRESWGNIGDAGASMSAAGASDDACNAQAAVRDVRDRQRDA